MKLLLLLMLLLPVSVQGQRLTLTRALRVKTLDQNSGDAQLLFKGLLQGKQSSLSFTLGYGQTIGNTWSQPKSSWGVFGSGLANSELYSSVSRLGPQYLSEIRDFGWGHNGLNFTMNGKLDKLSFGGSYSGYLDMYSFNFSGTVGSMTGKGVVVGRDGKVEEMRTDVEIKF